MLLLTPRLCAAAVLAAASVTSGAVAVAAPAAASSPGPMVGAINHAWQSGRHTMTVTGWALDRSRPSRSINVHLRVNGRFRAMAATTVHRAGINDRFSAPGRHGFVAKLHFAGGHRGPNSVGLRGSNSQFLDVHRIRVMGSRIVTKARRFIGSRYVWGGSSPRGFDCSGYAMYVYRHAHAGRLPHNAEMQRRRVRSIHRSQIRPGDLIFYMSGGHSYHVAIYVGGGTRIGKGRIFSAATPRQGVIRDHIWSRNIRFGTTWHS